MLKFLIMFCQILIMSITLNQAKHNERSYVSELEVNHTYSEEGLHMICGSTSDCIHIPSADCISQKCQCIKGTKENNRTCVMGGTCLGMKDCSNIIGALCKDGACICPDSLVLLGAACLEPNRLNVVCSEDKDCLIGTAASELELVCVDSKCSCPTAMATAEDGKSCVSKDDNSSASTANPQFELTSISSLLALLTITAAAVY